MRRRKPHPPESFERLASFAARAAGSTPAFIVAFAVIILWIVTGPVFHYSDTWQLAINTGTTIITFLMVFLIQRSQNKDSRALHLKLNELVASLQGPSNRLIDAEHLSEAELETLGKYYQTLGDMAKNERDLSVTHSIEEAEELHREKYSKK